MHGQRPLADIYDYWFEGIDDSTVIVKKQPPFVKWFRSTQVLDAEMRGFFAHLLEDGPVVMPPDDDGRTALCRVILYDQLTRNMFRGTSRAYAYDAAARDISRALIAGGRHTTNMLIERAFIYMPLTHSENRDDQELSENLSAQLLTAAKGAGSPNTAFFESNLSYARKYREIIDRFGRFPHRNAILDRPSTPEEEEFLCGK